MTNKEVQRYIMNVYGLIDSKFPVRHMLKYGN
jgi:hypothetical protein